MGEHCPNCALWGDEFNGMLKHLEKVTGFVVISPDDPETQKAFATKRDGKITVQKQSDVDSDGHAKSVLDVLWMLPGANTEEIAF